MSDAPSDELIEAIIRGECCVQGRCKWMLPNPCQWKCDGHDLARAAITSYQKAIEGEGGDAEIAAQLRKLMAAYPLGTMDWPLDVMTNAAAALERRAPRFPRLAIESLRNLNRQMDPDGVMVGVSREALHEVLVWIAVYEKEHPCPTSK